MRVVVRPTRILRLIMENQSIIRAAIFWGSLSIIWLTSIGNLISALLIATIFYSFSGGWRYLKMMYNTVPRDLRGLYHFIQMKVLIRHFEKNDITVGIRFQEIARKFSNKVCFYYEDKTWTFQEVEEYANRIANCFAELGFRPGDDVALFMSSCPEFVCIWLGLSKIGVIPALINYNLRLETLVHCLTVVKCKAVIFESSLQSAIRDVVPILKEKTTLQYFCHGDFDGVSFPAKSLNLLAQESSPYPPNNGHKGKYSDRLFYIYTSGTTGMPKAAIIKHARYVWMGAAVKYLKNVKDSDIIYSSLPLYHTAGSIVGCAQCLIFGSSLAIRNKFSASKFWDDCIKYNCTVANYIGETCRYLLAQPERPVEKQHKVRLMFGNGLRPQIWEQFKNRFGIKEIGEFYGSTEGNANIINIDNTVGCVGFTSMIIPSVYPISLIKVDETGKPIRNSKGLCIKCRPGEPGELVGKIINTDPLRSFDGYVNSSANDKKIVRNVFKHGDFAFLSGDTLVMDENGYLYFVDRTGDTFRWKGENVSTTEVEGVISKIVGNKDSVVYGVSVPGCEGKAGMAAICDPNHEINLDHLLSEMRKVLPLYAVPLFLRFVSEVELTGTFKLKKNKLREEEFDISKVKDPLYYLDIPKQCYVQLNESSYKDICEGKIRL
ncbi:long-chain fatty acid transport protein 4-like isoform X1 [Centruroides vittatus]|uniref:long-chain fatty acid transport protein 4-like isoform X1 n=1 Tax=Centruroides vittatus TaxID=120091 RepID=UPI00351097CA